MSQGWNYGKLRLVTNAILSAEVSPAPFTTQNWSPQTTYWRQWESGDNDVCQRGQTQLIHINVIRIPPVCVWQEKNKQREVTVTQKSRGQFPKKCFSISPNLVIRFRSRASTVLISYFNFDSNLIILAWICSCEDFIFHNLSSNHPYGDFHSPGNAFEGLPCRSRCWWWFNL